MTFGAGWRSGGGRRRRRAQLWGVLTAEELIELEAAVDDTDAATVASAAGVDEETITALLDETKVFLGLLLLVRAYLASLEEEEE